MEAEVDRLTLAHLDKHMFKLLRFILTTTSLSESMDESLARNVLQTPFLSDNRLGFGSGWLVNSARMTLMDIMACVLAQQPDPLVLPPFLTGIPNPEWFSAQRLSKYVGPARLSRRLVLHMRGAVSGEAGDLDL